MPQGFGSVTGVLQTAQGLPRLAIPNEPKSLKV